MRLVRKYLAFILKSPLPLSAAPLSLQPEILNGLTEVLFIPCLRQGGTFPEEVRQGSPGGERLKGIIINTG